MIMIQNTYIHWVLKICLLNLNIVVGQAEIVDAVQQEHTDVAFKSADMFSWEELDPSFAFFSSLEMQLR